MNINEANINDKLISKLVEDLNNGHKETSRDLFELYNNIEDFELKDKIFNELETVGYAFSIDRLNTLGWFQRFGETIDGFDTLCNVLGEDFLAYTIIAGVQIKTLIVDPNNPGCSKVEYKIDSSKKVEDMEVAEFQKRLASLMLQEISQYNYEDSIPLDLNKIRQIIGVHFLLLASYYEIIFKRFFAFYINGKINLYVEIKQIDNNENQTMHIFQFQNLIRDIIRDKLYEISTPLKLDISLVEKAEKEYLDKNYNKVISILGSWITPLSMFFKTPYFTFLDKDVKDKIGYGALLLSRAYKELSRQKFAEDLARIALYLLDNDLNKAEVFYILGEIAYNENRWGESIGFFRRSLFLGKEAEKIYPFLGISLIKSQKYIAGLTLLEECRKKGIETELIEKNLLLVYNKLSSKGPKLRRLKAYNSIDATKYKDLIFTEEEDTGVTNLPENKEENKKVG